MGFIIDTHIHIGLSGNFFVPYNSLKQILSLLEYLNIEKSISSHWLWLNGYLEEGLEESIKVYNLSGKRIYFLGIFDPNDSALSIKVLEKALKEPGFLGIKIHPSFHNLSADDAGYESVWEFASKNNFPLLTHSWSTSSYNPSQRLSCPEKFLYYIKKYPEVKIIFAHAGGRGDGRKQLIKIVNEFPNVYLDFAGDIYCYGLVPDLLNVISEDKIVFGSDLPMIDPRANLTRIILANIPEDTKIKILRNNALNIYKLEKK